VIAAGGTVSKLVVLDYQQTVAAVRSGAVKLKNWSHLIITASHVVKDLVLVELALV